MEQDLSFTFAEIALSDEEKSAIPQYKDAVEAARILSDHFKRKAYGEKPNLREAGLNTAQENIAKRANGIQELITDRLVEGIPYRDRQDDLEIPGQVALKIFLGEMCGFFARCPIDVAMFLPISSVIGLHGTVGQVDLIRKKMPESTPFVDQFFDNQFLLAEKRAKDHLKHLERTYPRDDQSPFRYGLPG